MGAGCCASTVPRPYLSGAMVGDGPLAAPHAAAGSALSFLGRVALEGLIGLSLQPRS